MENPVELADIENLIVEVLTAITTSEEWLCHREELQSVEWLDSRAPFVRFFDAYEGKGREDWLGIMEWAVVEVLRTEGSNVAPDQKHTAQVVAKMTTHPDLRTQR